MKICWESGGIAPSFLISALDGREWLVSRPCLFNSEEGAPGIHWIGGCMGPRDGLDTWKGQKSLSLAGNRIPATGRSTVSIQTDLSPPPVNNKVSYILE
jgi:hypothetical protein